MRKEFGDENIVRDGNWNRDDSVRVVKLGVEQGFGDCCGWVDSLA